MARFVDRVRDDRGAAAVEFALVGPLLILLVMGIVVYGGWLWLAQGVHSLAVEGARAAVAGLDDAERSALAHAHVIAHTDALSGADPSDLIVRVQTTSDTIRVTVTYDALGHPLMTLAALVPAPPAAISRSAVVRTGGW